MTVTLGWLDNQRFTVCPINPPLPVFVQDMPAPRGPADAAHTGLAEMVAMLLPVLPAGRTMAVVRLPSGARRHVDADVICPPTNVAPLRLRPGIHGARAGRAASHA